MLSPDLFLSSLLVGVASCFIIIHAGIIPVHPEGIDDCRKVFLVNRVTKWQKVFIKLLEIHA
jgi:hypothetical protein